MQLNELFVQILNSLDIFLASSKNFELLQYVSALSLTLMLGINSFTLHHFISNKSSTHHCLGRKISKIFIFFLQLAEEVKIPLNLALRFFDSSCLWRICLYKLPAHLLHFTLLDLWLRACNGASEGK